jgi:hypothetical protein
MCSIYKRDLCEASRRRTVFTDEAACSYRALGNDLTGKTTLPVDQTLLSRCGVRPLGNAGDFDVNRIELDKPYLSI